jgi:Mn-dependent DtxR family transcriptional regulator
MTEEAIEVLQKLGLKQSEAEAFLTKLEEQGYTVYRKKVFKNIRRPTSSQPMTPELRAAIFEYFEADSEATQQEIANIFNVNIGRVNEVLS